MVRDRQFRHLPYASLLALAVLFFAVAPLQATVSTVYSCPSSGISGNHDAVFNGFFVQGLAAVNLHTVTIYYTTDQDGLYNITLTAQTGSYGGPMVGTAQTQQNVNLSSSGETPVTFNFGDAPFTSGSTVYFTHTYSGSGNVSFNLQQTSDCPADQESIGTSSNLNGFSVAVTITQNTAPSNACAANNQTLCIDNLPGDKRFKVTATFATAQGGGLSGNGQAISLASLGVTEGGLFWFFGASNPEMLIKVINACSVNNHIWVFYSAGTNVGFKVTVTDTKNGHFKSYMNPDLTAAPPVQDTSALPCP